MTVMLLRISGVPLLEKTLTATRPGYQEHVESTSAFVPWFPRQPKQRFDESPEPQQTARSVRAGCHVSGAAYAKALHPDPL